jgi:hypothetical protein
MVRLLVAVAVAVEVVETLRLPSRSPVVDSVVAAVGGLEA